MPVYDGGVFDFSSFYTTGFAAVPAVLKVCIPEVFHNITSEQSIPIIVYIITTSITAGRKSLLNPSGGVTINIFNPDNTLLITNAPMVNIDLGIYLYPFNQQLTNNGVYTASFQAIHDVNVMKSKRYFICRSKLQLYG